MKNIDREWLKAAIEREGDCEIGAGFELTDVRQLLPYVEMPWWRRLWWQIKTLCLNGPTTPNHEGL